MTSRDMSVQSQAWEGAVYAQCKEILSKKGGAWRNCGGTSVGPKNLNSQKSPPEILQIPERNWATF